ncbi:hypothetical protein NL676_012393 [Syzygium grande]|nr:hypothetical protein NL676_012393 [Syzygium grande]
MEHLLPPAGLIAAVLQVLSVQQLYRIYIGMTTTTLEVSLLMYVSNLQLDTLDMLFGRVVIRRCWRLAFPHPSLADPSPTPSLCGIFPSLAVDHMDISSVGQSRLESGMDYRNLQFSTGNSFSAKHVSETRSEVSRFQSHPELASNHWSRGKVSVLNQMAKLVQKEIIDLLEKNLLGHAYLEKEARDRLDYLDFLPIASSQFKEQVKEFLLCASRLAEVERPTNETAMPNVLEHCSHAKKRFHDVSEKYSVTSDAYAAGDGRIKHLQEDVHCAKETLLRIKAELHECEVEHAELQGWLAEITREMEEAKSVEPSCACVGCSILEFHKRCSLRDWCGLAFSNARAYRGLIEVISKYQQPCVWVLKRRVLSDLRTVFGLKHENVRWDVVRSDRRFVLRAVVDPVSSGEPRSDQEEVVKSEEGDPLAKFHGIVTSWPLVVYVMKRKSRVLDLLLADLVKRGLLRSDRRGISRPLKYDDPFNNPLVKVGMSNLTLEMCGKVYRLAPVTLTKEQEAIHKKRRSRAYQWKRPTMFLKEGDMIPPDVDPDMVRWIPANHPFATTASEIDEDLAQTNVY